MACLWQCIVTKNGRQKSKRDGEKYIHQYIQYMHSVAVWDFSNYVAIILLFAIAIKCNLKSCYSQMSNTAQHNQHINKYYSHSTPRQSFIDKGNGIGPNIDPCRTLFKK